MSGALAGRQTDKELEKGRVEKTTVKRYWPGKAPSWVEQQQQQEQAAAVPSEYALAQQVQRTAISAPVVVKKVADPRLARLAQCSTDRDEAVEEHRQIRAAEVVRRHRPSEGDDQSAEESEDQSESNSEAEEEAQQEQEEDEEELQKRRDALKERLRQQQEQELLAAAGDEEEEEEESSEYTSDDESEEEGGRKLVKPVFVRKTERDTIAARQAAEAAEAAAEEEKQKRLAERQQETRQLLVQVIAADAQAALAAATAAVQRPKGAEDVEDVDTSDEAEPDSIDLWQRREAARIRRDAAEREAQEEAAAERERLRNMTEEERLAWLKANRPQDDASKPQKAKWRFLQKYWHKGAFFQDEADDLRATIGTDDIFKRDFSAPTGEDNFDKSVLPAVMQVKNFGRSGRTKWTHLLNEDTSVQRKEDEWYKREEKIAGAVAGGYSRDTAALQAGPSVAKRSGDLLSEGFTKPKKFKT